VLVGALTLAAMPLLATLVASRATQPVAFPVETHAPRPVASPALVAGRQRVALARQEATAPGRDRSTPRPAPAPPAASAPPREAATHFAIGVRAYGARRYEDARRAFRAAAAAAPRAPDAWANAGTAAWAAGDTLGAAVGWQRALRLDPRAEDVRDRLLLLPAAHGGWIAAVPPVPSDWVAAAALALWTAAGAAALALARRAGARARTPGALSRVVGYGAAGAAAAIACALVLADVAAARKLAIVRQHDVLRSEPALAGEAGEPARLTEVARVETRQGVWARVALDGDRGGWIASDRLEPLALP
jgi:tetratricopeptide (TPR) repeat protein